MIECPGLHLDVGMGTRQCCKHISVGIVKVIIEPAINIMPFCNKSIHATLDIRMMCVILIAG